MTVIDTIITCALYMWHGLSWVVSSSWQCSKIVHAFFTAQPSSVQIALFIGFVLIAWLLFVLGNGFHNKFMAVPENEIWINTVRIALFAWRAGEGFATSVIFTGEGFIEFFQGIFLLFKGLGKFVLGVLGFIVIGFAWPFLAIIVLLYALCAIIYGICWAFRDTDRIFMTLEPSHNIAFRRAAGLSVMELAPSHNIAIRRAPVSEQAPAGNTRSGSGPARGMGPTRRRTNINPDAGRRDSADFEDRGRDGADNGNRGRDGANYEDRGRD
jgi:hypothetical protein